MAKMKELAEEIHILNTLHADVSDFRFVYPAIQKQIAHWIFEDRKAKIKAESMKE